MKTLKEQLEIVKRNFPSLKLESINPNLEKGNALVVNWGLFSPDYLNALKMVFGVAGIESDLNPNFDYGFSTDKYTENKINYGKCFGVDMDFGQSCTNVSPESFNRFHYQERQLCGAPAFMVALQLLIHPNILSHSEDLSIICVADTANNPGFREYRASPIFYYRKGKVHFSLIGIDKSFPDCGCATLINF